jgi:hypothetical protein
MAIFFPHHCHLFAFFSFLASFQPKGKVNVIVTKFTKLISCIVACTLKFHCLFFYFVFLLSHTSLASICFLSFLLHCSYFLHNSYFLFCVSMHQQCIGKLNLFMKILSTCFVSFSCSLVFCMQLVLQLFMSLFVSSSATFQLFLHLD